MKTSRHRPCTSAHHYYLTCPWKKGRPRKHVDVCRKCRRSRSCRTYQNYVQPSLFPGW
ncbi:MAG: hypothetical protein K9K82_12910 [Desulfobacteraceae bacterium]|nr:hypothetical protein [Desulfobacteraceae bacterium]